MDDRVDAAQGALYVHETTLDVGPDSARADRLRVFALMDSHDRPPPAGQHYRPTASCTSTPAKVRASVLGNLHFGLCADVGHPDK